MRNSNVLKLAVLIGCTLVFGILLSDAYVASSNALKINISFPIDRQTMPLSFQVKRRRRTPLQADGASKAPPHENGTR
jgi:hypothetical protein